MVEIMPMRNLPERHRSSELIDGDSQAFINVMASARQWEERDFERFGRGRFQDRSPIKMIDGVLMACKHTELHWYQPQRSQYRLKTQTNNDIRNRVKVKDDLASRVRSNKYLDW